MYKIIGADSKEYGPVSAEQLRQWITEGRVNGATRVQAEGATDWRPISSLPEFAALFPPVAPVTPVTPSLPPPMSMPMPTLPTGPKNNALAIWSMVTGILSVIQCCQIVCGPLAIVFGFIALSQIKANPGQTGSGFAITGIITGILGLLIGVVLWIVVFSNPQFLQSLQNFQNQLNH